MAKKNSKLFFADTSPNEYFPLNNESLYFRREIEKKIVEQLNKKERKIFLIYSQPNNGNTSFLNHIINEFYQKNPLYNKGIFSVTGISDGWNILLKSLYSKIKWDETLSFVKKAWLSFRYKMSLSEKIRKILATLLIYFCVMSVTCLVCVLSLGLGTNFNFINILIICISAFMPALLLSLANKIVSKICNFNKLLPEDDNDLIWRLSTSEMVENCFRRNPYGSHIFIDRTDQLKRPSQELLMEIIMSKMKRMNIFNCVLLFQNEDSRLLEVIKQSFRDIVEEYTLRPFSFEELELIAEANHIKTEDINLKEMKVAEVIRSLTPKEIKKFGIKLNDLRNTAITFDRLAFLNFLYFLPYEKKKIEIEYVKNALVYCSKQTCINIDFKFLFPDIRHFRDFYYPILFLSGSNDYYRNYRYSSLMLRKNKEYFEPSHIVAVNNLYFLLGVFNYIEQYPVYRGKNGRNVILRFTGCFKSGWPNFPNWNEEILKKNIILACNALFESGQYFFKKVDFDNSRKAIMRLLDFASEYKFVNEKIIVDVSNILLEISLLTLTFEFVESIRRSKDINIERIFSLRDFFSGKSCIKIHTNIMEHVTYDDFFKLLYTEKRYCLWSSVYIKEVSLSTFPKVERIDNPVAELLLHFERATLFELAKNYTLFLDEVNTILTKLYCYRTGKLKIDLLKYIRPYFEVRILHFCYNLLTCKQISQNNKNSLMLDIRDTLHIDMSNLTASFIEIIEKYKRCESIFFLSSMDFLLIETYLNHTKLLMQIWQNSPDNYQHFYGEINTLINKGLTIEAAKNISFRSPSFYSLLVDLVENTLRGNRKSVLKEQIQHLIKFNYSDKTLKPLIRNLLEDMNRFGCGEDDYNTSIDFCRFYIKNYLNKDSGEDLFEKYNLILHYEIQSLNRLGLHDEALKKLDEIESALNMFPDSTEIISLNLAKDIIKHDILLHINKNKAKSIAENLYGEFCNAENFFRELSSYERFEHTLNEREFFKNFAYRVGKHEIINRAIAYLPKKEVERIAKAHYMLAKEDKNKIKKSYEEIMSYLKVAVRLCQLLVHQNLRLGTDILITAQELAQYINYGRRERQIIVLLLEILPYLLDEEAKYQNVYFIMQSRNEKILKLMEADTKRLVNEAMRKHEWDQVIISCKEYSLTFAPEKTPFPIYEKKLIIESAYARGDRSKIISELDQWYKETFDPEAVIYYDELILLKLYIKCLEEEKEKDKAYIARLKQQLVLYSRKKLIIECDKLMTSTSDLSIIELANFIKERIIETLPSE